MKNVINMLPFYDKTKPGRNILSDDIKTEIKKDIQNENVTYVVSIGIVPDNYNRIRVATDYMAISKKDHDKVLDLIINYYTSENHD